MYVAHQFGPYRTEKEIQGEPSLLLTNQKGSFFYWKDKPASRYHGFFVRRQGTLYRSLVGLQFGADLPVRRVVNHFSHLEVERSSGLRERFTLDPEHDALVWETSSPLWCSVLVDGKEIFDNDDWGRRYSVVEESHMLLIEFTKWRNDSRAYRFWIAVASNSFEHKMRKEWVLHENDFDRARNDPPYPRYVLRPFDVRGTQFVIAVGETKDEAKEAVRSTFRRMHRLFSAGEAAVRRFAASCGVLPKGHDMPVAYLAAKYSLAQMTVRDHNGKPEGLYAGIPWLSQFWLRDFVVSASQLEKDAALPLFRRYLDDWIQKGVLPASSLASELAYADTEGMFFFLASRFFDQKLLSRSEEADLAKLCAGWINGKLAGMRDGFVQNGPKETWMDTEFHGSGRAGARIEIQALFLRALNFAWKVTGDRAYREKHAELLRNLRMSFWDGEKLSDGLGDPTQRPNIFLAYHIAPEFLFRHEWKKAFTHTLEALWCEWGGLATISKNHSLLCGWDRGCTDPNQSYHHGDSWFFINNLAASALAQVDRKEFKPSIDRILAASTNDILWQGMCGWHSEVSSANAFVPGGCFAQSWSAATYCDALDTVLKLRLL